MQNTVECKTCGNRYENWVGSTPCCGSIALLVENGKVTDKMALFASINGGNLEELVIDFNSHNPQKP